MFQRIPASKSSILRRRTIFGVGVNDADYMVNMKKENKQIKCPAYKSWIRMMQRCYSLAHKEKHPTYIGCTVCDDWLNFSSFLYWYDDNYIDGYDLDKDIKIKDNKIYSPLTCMFVPKSINRLLNDHGAARGNFPIGVTIDNRRGKFLSRVSCGGGGKICLGLFDTPEEALSAYKLGKNKQIRNAMLEHKSIAGHLEKYLYNI